MRTTYPYKLIGTREWIASAASDVALCVVGESRLGYHLKHTAVHTSRFLYPQTCSQAKDLASGLFL